jgi:ribosomal 30S subunit maturation factor RimM
MTREKLVEKAIDTLSKLPDQKLIEVSDFAEFLIGKAKLTEGTQHLVEDSKLEKSNDVARFKGLLSNKEADKFQEYLILARSEWNRDI